MPASQDNTHFRGSHRLIHPVRYINGIIAAMITVHKGRQRTRWKKARLADFEYTNRFFLYREIRRNQPCLCPFLLLQKEHFSPHRFSYIHISTAHSPLRITGSFDPSANTPSISISSDPIMKSTCTTLVFPPLSLKSSSSMVAPFWRQTLYACPRATWLDAFSSNKVL